VKERDEESGTVRGLEGQIASPLAGNDRKRGCNDGGKRLATTEKEARNDRGKRLAMTEKRGWQ